MALNDPVSALRALLFDLKQHGAIERPVAADPDPTKPLISMESVRLT